jgi:hypothetical protein
MTRLGRRIASAIEAGGNPVGPRWTWYGDIAFAAGCSAQAVYLFHKAQGFRPHVAAPTICRECGKPMDRGAHGFCHRCCVMFGNSWRTNV